MSALKEELESLLKEKVRKEEVIRLIKRLYCQYIDDTKYSSKDFEDGNPKIESLYIEINSFYIYVEFEMEDAKKNGTGDSAYYYNNKVRRFERTLDSITKGKIENRSEEYIPKGDRYIVQIYFSNGYEIEVLE